MKNYQDMDQEELESLNEHLSNLLNERDAKIIDALTNRDLNALKIALNNNKKKIISRQAWKSVSFKDMSENDLDFFLYVRDLPNYDKYDQGAVITDLSKTEEAMNEAMNNKELFVAFINHPDLSSKLKKYLEHAAISDDIPTEVIEEMFNRELINPTQEFIDECIDHGYDNYVKYFLKGEKYKLNNEEYKKIYLNNWNTTSYNSILETTKVLFPKYKNIPLEEVFDSLDTESTNPKIIKYINGIKLNQDLLFTMMETHPVKKNDIINMLSTINQRSFYNIEKFENLINFIIKKLPHHIETLSNAKNSNIITSEALQPIFEKLVNFAELNNELKEKGVTPKKLKL